jgi:hypothetical protein
MSANAPVNKPNANNNASVNNNAGANNNAKNAGANNNAKNAGANNNAGAKNANKPSGGVLGALGSIFGAAKPANAANTPVVANANKNSPPALQPVEVAKSLNAPAKTRRRQRGGGRGKTMRLPGPRNVLRVTGKTVGKIRNVGVYGLKKVGNGVHMVTGLLGAGTKLVGSVLRKGGKTLKGLTKRRQQTRKQ